MIKWTRTSKHTSPKWKHELCQDFTKFNNSRVLVHNAPSRQSIIGAKLSAKSIIYIQLGTKSIKSPVNNKKLHNCAW